MALISSCKESLDMGAPLSMDMIAQIMMATVVCTDLACTFHDDAQLLLSVSHSQIRQREAGNTQTCNFQAEQRMATQTILHNPPTHACTASPIEPD
jgi:hypothetical protein